MGLTDHAIAGRVEVGETYVGPSFQNRGDRLNTVGETSLEPGVNTMQRYRRHHDAEKPRVARLELARRREERPED